MVFHVGDFIEEGWESFAVVEPLMEQLNMPYFHVLGNHDFWVQDSTNEMFQGDSGLSSRYYAITHKGWRFIVLDGNEISLHAWPQTSSEHQDSGLEKRPRTRGKRLEWRPWDRQLACFF